MPERNQQQDPPSQPETILIAHVSAHLLDGSSFELYPFVDDKDVKAKVSELVGGWANSGFLLRGSRMIPWHQVKLLEAISVEEISRQEAQQRLMSWQAEDQKRAVQGFWKTKEEEQGEKKESGDDQADQGGGQ